MTDIWCPFAKRQPLSFLDQLTDKENGKPRALRVHTNDGGPDLQTWFNDQFRQSGQRIGSTYQVLNDGTLVQMVPCNKVIYAEYGASVWSDSVETEDDGDPSRPWTDAQVDTLVKLIDWESSTFDYPPKLISSPEESGVSYHEQFPEYNLSGHVCPGPAREAQLRDTVLRLIGGPSTRPPAAPKPPAPPGSPAHVPSTPPPAVPGKDNFDMPTIEYGSPNVQLVRIVQGLTSAWGYATGIDGGFGPLTRLAVMHFQQSKGLAVDGIVGPHTWTKLLDQ